MIEIHYDPFHEYDKDVIEFFNTITYLGGRRVACFIRGPMSFNEGRGSHIDTEKEKRMNLGGPSYRTCLKRQAGYTNEPGVWKPLSLGQLELMKNFKALTMVETNVLTVYPCALGNDGTSLKPAIEFDERLKVNVGLSFNIDIDYVRNNPSPDAEFLKENLVTEAIVTSVTSLDNKCSLPVAVEYSGKAGKTAESCENMFLEQLKILQTCESCQKEAPSAKHIIKTCYERCTSFCQACYESKDVCSECHDKGQVSHHASLRACNSCLERKQICVRRAILVITADCETGNKGAFEQIRSSIEKEEIDPSATLLTVLPDCPHVGKSLKGSFANWWLKLGSERGNIALLRTLRNRSSPSTMSEMRRHIPKNDHVKNKDRQDPSAVLTLCSHSLTSFLSKIGYVCHTIIPELDKFTTDNRLGMYPSPVSVSVASYGWLVFLSWDNKRGSSTLYHARLHSPVDKITVIAKNLPSNQVHCKGGVAFLSSCDGPVLLSELEDNKLKLVASKITTKERQRCLEERFHFHLTGTLAEVREKAKKLLKRKEDEYQAKGYKREQINFPNDDTCNHIQAIAMVDEELCFFADLSSKKVVSACLKYDGYGICANNIKEIVDYQDRWSSVSSMCVNDQNMYVAHKEGISVVNLATHFHKVVYYAENCNCILAPYKNGALFSDQSQSSILEINHDDEINLFAGSKVEGCQDGPAKQCQFKQPIGICVEFDTVVYACDAQSNSVKLITPLKETAQLLDAIGKLYDAFSVHKKGQSYSNMTLSEASNKVQQCKQVLMDFERAVRSTERLPNILNGPQGMVSAATVKSVDILAWGLQRLDSIMSSLGIVGTNLLSCMTLDVEHLHSTSHIKHPLLSKQEYCRDFGNTVKESIKRLSSSSFYYYTSEKASWYPKPEHGIDSSALPLVSPLPQINMDEKSVGEMRNYACTYGAAVRQRTTRQETTMAKHGTMPEMIYQRKLVITERTNFASHKDKVVDAEQIDDSTGNEVEEVELEYDLSTDDEDDDETNSELDKRSTFLVGVSTRYGRAVRINNKYIS